MPPQRDEGRVAEAARLYQSGKTSRQVGEQMGVPASTIQRWLRDPGVELRPRGPRQNAVTDQRILDYRDKDGLAYARIARLVGMSETGTRNRYYKLTGRTRAERA